MKFEDREYGEDHCVTDLINREGASFFDQFPELTDHEKELISSARSIRNGDMVGGRCSDCARKGYFKRNGSMVACGYYKTVARLIESVKARKERG
jgi:hypothetical protein